MVEKETSAGYGSHKLAMGSMDTIYTSNLNSNDVSVIPLSTNIIIQSITVDESNNITQQTPTNNNSIQNTNNNGNATSQESSSPSGGSIINININISPGSGVGILIILAIVVLGLLAYKIIRKLIL